MSHYGAVVVLVAFLCIAQNRGCALKSCPENHADESMICFLSGDAIYDEQFTIYSLLIDNWFQIISGQGKKVWSMLILLCCFSMIDHRKYPLFSLPLAFYSQSPPWSAQKPRNGPHFSFQIANCNEAQTIQIQFRAFRYNSDSNNDAKRKLRLKRKENSETLEGATSNKEETAIKKNMKNKVKWK